MRNHRMSRNAAIVLACNSYAGRIAGKLIPDAIRQRRQEARQRALVIVIVIVIVGVIVRDTRLGSRDNSHARCASLLHDMFFIGTLYLKSCANRH